MLKIQDDGREPGEGEGQVSAVGERAGEDLGVGRGKGTDQEVAAEGWGEKEGRIRKAQEEAAPVLAGGGLLRRFSACRS